MDGSVIRQDITVSEFVSERVSVEYPCFVFKEGNDPLVVMYNNLEEGNMSLIFDTGTMRKTFPKKISGSAYNVQKLLRVISKLYYYNEKGESFEIKSVFDYLDAVIA